MSLKRQWVYVVAVGLAAVVAYLAINMNPGEQSRLPEGSSTLAATPTGGSLTIVTFVDGDIAEGAVYRIAPDPYTGMGNYTLSEGDFGIDTSKISGIITIEGIADGTYSVIQTIGPEGQQRDVIPRVLSIRNGSSEAITFGTNVPGGSAQDSGSSNFGNIESITYAAKFECGTIRGTEGPLRPGHYDTDIGIFNKQTFPLQVAWTAALDDREPTNAILKTMKAQTSTAIVCSDIRTVLNLDDKFVEGFVLIEVPVDPILIASLSSSISILASGSQEGIDVLDVQIFYTANALEELPHPVIVDKISFVITSKGAAANIPDSMIGKTLDITLPSEVERISDPVERVKAYLAQNYNVTSAQTLEVSIEIKSVDIGVGTMIDDHAISLSKVRPQARFS